MIRDGKWPYRFVIRTCQGAYSPEFIYEDLGATVDLFILNLIW